MEDNKILQEIENAILEEQNATIKAENTTKEVAKYQNYLKNNIVTLPLADFIMLYESTKALDKLVGLLLANSELGYQDEGLKINTFESHKVMDYVKELEPLRYVELYEALLEATK